MVETEEEYLEQMEILVCFFAPNYRKYIQVHDASINHSGLIGGFIFFYSTSSRQLIKNKNNKQVFVHQFIRVFLRKPSYLYYYHVYP